MTALPEPAGRLLTVDAYAALGEDDRYRSELQEGNLVMSPSPAADHMIVMTKLLVQLDTQLPPESAASRVRRDGGFLRACDALLVVEIVSPGSHRADHVIKRGEYADAGIPHYWIVDIDGQVTLTACHRAAEFGYQDAGSVTGRFTTTEPFPACLRLDGLLPG